jgi:hypothetical protein
VIHGKIGPREGFESGPRCRHRRALQRGLFQYLRAAGLAFFVELFRGRFQGLEDRWVRCLLRVFCGIEPTTQRLSARFEACHGLPLNYNWRNAFQVVIKLTEMIQRVDDPDKTRTRLTSNAERKLMTNISGDILHEKSGYTLTSNLLDSVREAGVPMT